MHHIYQYLFAITIIAIAISVYYYSPLYPQTIIPLDYEMYSEFGIGTVSATGSVILSSVSYNCPAEYCLYKAAYTKGCGFGAPNTLLSGVVKMQNQNFRMPYTDLGDPITSQACYPVSVQLWREPQIDPNPNPQPNPTPVEFSNPILIGGVIAGLAVAGLVLYRRVRK